MNSPVKFIASPAVAIKTQEFLKGGPAIILAVPERSNQTEQKLPAIPESAYEN
jgi:hypothetical protein